MYFISVIIAAKVAPLAWDTSVPGVILQSPTWQWQLDSVTLQWSQEVCEGMSGASLAVDGFFPSCALLGYRLMFTIINTIAVFKKDIIIEYKLDHNYCILKLRIHGLHVSK